MAAGVSPVHKAGLGGGVYLLQQSIDRQRRKPVFVNFCKMLRQKTGSGRLQLGNTVQPAGGTARAGFSADYAISAFAAYGIAGQLLPVCIQYIHVEKPPHGIAVLDGNGNGFQPLRRRIRDAVGLAAGDVFCCLPMQNGDVFRFQRMQKRPAAVLEASCDQRRQLDGAGNVHGEANQAFLTAVQQ